MQHFDAVVIGGGIVGLATLYQASERFPDWKLGLLEKESQLAQHQTGHNSGVLHSGIYYKPGSLKARNCRVGKQMMEQFCQTHGISYEICGKVIVATSEDELPSLERIYERGQQNGVRCEIIEPSRLAELEPYAAGIRAIHVHDAGIVDFQEVCRRLGQITEERGCRLITSARVDSIRHSANESVVHWPGGEVAARYVINCTGLQSDRMARMTGQKPEVRIIPFRGEYYQLKPQAFHLCRNLIYPVPDPKFPFLGVHFTRMIDGSVECGPNAVFALAREGYRKWNLSPRDLFESLAYPGFLRLAIKYWRIGLGETWRSISKRAFVHALQRLVPEIRGDLIQPAPSGIRAQAVAADGTMVDDFLILSSDRIINVCNAPSPAATSALNIGQTIVDQLAERTR